MTLRDYFAAKAMQAIITKLPVVDREGEFGAPVEDKISTTPTLQIRRTGLLTPRLEERAK